MFDIQFHGSSCDEKGEGKEVHNIFVRIQFQDKGFSLFLTKSYVDIKCHRGEWLLTFRRRGVTTKYVLSVIKKNICYYNVPWSSLSSSGYMSGVTDVVFKVDSKTIIPSPSRIPLPPRTSNLFSFDNRDFRSMNRRLLGHRTLDSYDFLSGGPLYTFVNRLK